MKATLLLRKDHEKIHELCENFRKSLGLGQSEQHAVFQEIRLELLVHSNIENEVFYSELKSSSSSRDIVEMIDTLIDDHDKVEKLLQEIAHSNGNGMPESKVNLLIELMEAHVAKEEDQLFVEARRVFSEQRLEELGLEMEHRRRMFTLAVA